MAVLVGGVVTTFATTGNTGVPLSFLVVGVALGLLMVGYVVMAYRAGNAAPVYAFMSLGFGPAWGIAFGALSFVAYNAIQISLYPLVGSLLAGFVGVGSWTTWAWVVWLAVAAFGVANFSLGKVFVAVVGVAEIAMIAALILAAFTHPHGGHVSVEPMTVRALWDRQGQIGGVFSLSVAAFVGVDTGAVYAEEGVTEKTVVRATVGALVFLPVFYTALSWALPVWTGPDQITDAARGADSTGFPLNILQQNYGGAVFGLAEFLLVTSLFISALSFHNVVGRYIHAIAREDVISARLARVGLLGGQFAGATAPASLLQSGIGAVVLTLFWAAGTDPVKTMFVWLSSGAGVGILVMLVGTSIATVFYHRKGGGGRREHVLVRTALPIAGAVVGSALVLTIIVNQSSLLGVAGFWPQSLIPAAVLLTIAAGFLYAWFVKIRRPEAYAGVGRGRPNVVTVPDLQIGDIRV